ncbi:UNVERIFIED_CONTAM: hypothetical protein PYX00_004550 [Menopon gallinae]|uniref:Uncharacterized protein n=1 Tax=Menopon gallinae TaxID=328185 RepID=A0AAW2I4M2_9NEOP
MDTYQYDADFRHTRYRSTEYISDLDPFGSRSAVYNGPVEQFSFQRNHRFYASVPRNYDRRKQEIRYHDRHLDNEVKARESYRRDDVKENSQMYQNNKNVIPENYYENKDKINYVAYQEYEADGYRQEKVLPGGQSVVVNLDNTGNSVSTVLGNGRFADRGGAEPAESSGGCCLSGLCPSGSSRISSTYPPMEETGVCRPSLLLFLLVLLIIVFICVSAVLLYLNYAVFKPRPQIIEGKSQFSVYPGGRKRPLRQERLHFPGEVLA